MLFVEVEISGENQPAQLVEVAVVVLEEAVEGEFEVFLFDDLFDLLAVVAHCVFEVDQETPDFDHRGVFESLGHLFVVLELDYGGVALCVVFLEEHDFVRKASE